RSNLVSTDGRLRAWSLLSVRSLVRVIVAFAIVCLARSALAQPQPPQEQPAPEQPAPEQPQQPPAEPQPAPPPAQPAPEQSAPKPLDQTITIRGRVINSLGRPLRGARVSIEGASEGVTTGKDGWFRIQAPIGSTLVIESNGYEVGLATVDGATLDDVVL